MTAVPNNNKKRRRGLFITISILLTLVTATLSLLPLGIEYALGEAIRQHGGEQVSVGNIDFNPFTATLRVDDLKVTNQGENQLALPRLDLQLAWRPLFSRQLVITGMDLSGVALKLIQDGTQSQLQVGGMQFPTSTEQTAAETAPWAIHLNQIDLSDTLIDYQDPKLETRVQVAHLVLTGIASDNKTAAAQVELQGSIDQSPVRLNGRFTPFADTPSFDGVIQIQSLTLNSYSRLVAPQLTQLKGKLSMDGAIALSTSQSGSARIALDGTISLADYRVGDQARDIAGSRLSWQGRLNRDADTVSLNGDLTSTDIRFDAEDGDTSYSHQNLQWQGTLTFSSSASTQNILSSSQLNIQAPGVRQGENHWAAQQLDLSLEKGTLSLTGEGLAAHLPGSLKLAGAEMTTAKQTLVNESLNWEGTAQFNRHENLTTMALNGSLSDGPALLTLLEEQATLGLQNLAWQGEVELLQDEHGNRIKPAGDLTANGLEAIDKRANLQLLALDSIDINHLTGDSESGLTASLIDARSISTGTGLPKDAKNNAAMLALDSLQISQSEYSKSNGLRIDRVETSGLRQAVVRQPDNSLNLQQLADAFRRLAGGLGTQAETAPEKPMPIAIQQLTLAGDSQIGFEDRTTDPVYHLKLKPEQFSMRDITNSPADKPARLLLKGVLDKSSLLELNGDLALFATQPTFSLKGRIEGLELPPLSAYTIPLLGYRLQSGKANSDIQFTAKGGQVEGSSDLTLNQLEVEPLDSEKMAAMQQQLSIPLETALGMLKDKNNQIKLTLPISGAVDNIQVDPSDAINQAIGRAMKKGAKTYLATALFPFGTLLTLVELAGDAAAKIQLDPIPFTPGSSQLNPDQHAYLDKIAELLNDRPEVYIRLCGVSAAADMEALQQVERQRREAAATKGKKQADGDEETPDSSVPPPVEISEQRLQQLATDRTTSIERYLSTAHKVKTERLISCQPRVEKAEEKKAAARVDLLI